MLHERNMTADSLRDNTAASTACLARILRYISWFIHLSD